MENKSWIMGLCGVALVAMIAIFIVFELTKEPAGSSGGLSPTPTHVVPSGAVIRRTVTEVPEETPTPTEVQEKRITENWVLTQGKKTVIAELDFPARSYVKSIPDSEDPGVSLGTWKDSYLLRTLCEGGRIQLLDDFGSRQILKFDCTKTESGFSYAFEFEGVPQWAYSEEEMTLTVAVAEDAVYRVRQRENSLSYYCNDAPLFTITRENGEIRIVTENDRGSQVLVTYFEKDDSIDDYCTVEDEGKVVCYSRETGRRIWALDRHYNGENTYRLITYVGEDETETVLYQAEYGTYPSVAYFGGLVNPAAGAEDLLKLTIAGEQAAEPPTEEWAGGTATTELLSGEFGKLTVESTICAVYSETEPEKLAWEALSRRIRVENAEWHLAFADDVVNPDCRITKTEFTEANSLVGAVGCTAQEYRRSDTLTGRKVVSTDGALLWTGTVSKDAEGRMTEETRIYRESKYFHEGTTETSQWSNGRINKMTRTRSDGTVTEFIYAYDGGGKRQRVQYTVNGKLRELYQYTYAEDGMFKQLEKTVFDESGEIVSVDDYDEWKEPDTTAGL